MSYTQELDELPDVDIFREALRRLKADEYDECSYCGRGVTDPPCKISGNHRPAIVCLCGSTRFGDAFAEANLNLTLAGHIVLSVGALVSDATLGITQESDVKKRLDALHLQKIRLADAIHVLNVGGYIGESTRREIEYATDLGKIITYMEKAE